MTNLNKKQREAIYPYVVAKQGGEFCVGCGRDKKRLIDDGHKPEFCIDNFDNSGNHRDVSNLQLLCHSCNSKKNHPQTDLPFHRTPTPEMAANKKNEPAFRRWVMGHYLINPNAGLEQDFVMTSGAEKIGCSIEAIKNYLRKMTSAEGMYTWEERFDSTVLILKDEFRASVE